MNTINILVGISGSGKSSYANTQLEVYAHSYDAPELEVISSDDLRKELYGDINDQTHNNEVFTELRKRMEQALLNNKDVIIDATNLTMKSRRPIIDKIKELKHRYNTYYNIVATIMATPLLDCLVRNEKRARTLPTKVIYNMRDKFQMPFLEEGFDNIQIEEEYDTKNSVAFYVKMMRNFNQYNPWHSKDLLTHSVDSIVFAKHGVWFCTASLLHDVGKLFTQKFDDGSFTHNDNNIAHYYNHAQVGAYEVLTQIDLGGTFEERLNTIFLINYHMLPFSWKLPKTHEKEKKIFGEYKYNLLMEFHKNDMSAC